MKRIIIFSLFFLCGCSILSISEKEKHLSISEKDFFKNFVRDYNDLSKSSINICNALNYSYKSLTSLEIDRQNEVNNLKSLILACRNSFNNISEKRLKLRDRAFKFFKQAYHNPGLTYENFLQLEKIKYLYASLQASIQIAEREIENYLEPVIIHNDYILEKGLPNDRNMLDQERLYVSSRYEIFSRELYIINNHSEVILNLLDDVQK